MEARLKAMGTSKGTKRLWHQTGSGLAVPGGIESRILHASSQTFLDIKVKALAIEEMFAADGVRLPLDSDLARMISDAKSLSDRWLSGQPPDSNTWSLMFRALMLDPIGDALLMLGSSSDRARFLWQIASGTLDLLEHTPSPSKDVLWEVELWAMLKRRGMSAALQEPPDIVVESGNKRIAIACKKLYSERHVQNVLSEAVERDPIYEATI